MECQHALKEINRYLTCRLLPKHIQYLHSQKKFYQPQGGQLQVEHPHKNIDYLQYLRYPIKVLVTPHCCNPYQTYPLFFVN